jgi:hypothetical protein
VPCLLADDAREVGEGILLVFVKQQPVDILFFVDHHRRERRWRIFGSSLLAS